MADPVAAYSHEEALRVGRELERLNYYWLEEPLFDVDFHGLRKLTASLDIPIIGTEVLAGSHYSTAECIATGVVDMVRTDVSWKGGITPVMKTAHLAESFGVKCELHTTIYHPLEVVNLHCCCAISNCEFFELLYPLSYMDFGMNTSWISTQKATLTLRRNPEPAWILTGTLSTAAPSKNSKNRFKIQNSRFKRKAIQDSRGRRFKIQEEGDSRFKRKAIQDSRGRRFKIQEKAIQD